jgi:small subunit ribosomal protein S20
MRQEQKTTLRNHTVKSEARTAITNARNAIKSEAESAKQKVQTAASILDHAVRKGVLHRNNAARRKSRLMKQLHIESTTKE